MLYLLTSCTWHMVEKKNRFDNARDCVFNFLAGDSWGMWEPGRVVCMLLF